MNQKIAARITVPRAMKFINVASRQIKYPDLAAGARSLDLLLSNYARLARKQNMTAERALGSRGMGETVLGEHERNNLHNRMVQAYEDFAQSFYAAKKKPLPLMQGRHTGLQIPPPSVAPLEARGKLQHLSFSNFNNELGAEVLGVDPAYRKFASADYLIHRALRH